MNTPCDVKKLYDTEWEAERAANEFGYKIGAEMVPYKCGSHWHIANKEPKLRSKVRPFRRTYCAVCNTYMKVSTYRKHTSKPRHIALESEMRKNDTERKRSTGSA